MIMAAMNVDIAEAQTQFSKLIALALQGKEVVITQDGTPLIQLAPARPQTQRRIAGPRRIAGLHRGAMRMREDFNDPLPDEFWLGDA
jgi:prevent-host-death family protein